MHNKYMLEHFEQVAELKWMSIINVTNDKTGMISNT